MQGSSVSARPSKVRLPMLVIEPLPNDSKKDPKTVAAVGSVLLAAVLIKTSRMVEPALIDRISSLDMSIASKAEKAARKAARKREVLVSAIELLAVICNNIDGDWQVNLSRETTNPAGHSSQPVKASRSSSYVPSEHRAQNR